MKQHKDRLVPVITILIIMVIWELLVQAFDVPLYVLPAPSDILEALIDEAGTLFAHAKVTVFEAVCGMAIALALSIVLGMLMDRFPVVRQALYPILVATQTVPMIVLAPLFIIYMGFGIAPKILTVVLMCFFPIAVNFTDGLMQVNEEYVHLVRSYGTETLGVYRLVKIPAALPSLMSGLKVAATYSISGAVVGEWIGSQSGLGYYIIKAKNGYMLDRVFATVVIIIVLSLCMNGIISIVSKAMMPHMRKNRKGKTYEKPKRA